MLTRISAKGITQEIVRRWKDKVGETINPAGDAAAEDPFAGMSRLQRERMEKKARKGTLRTV